MYLQALRGATGVSVPCISSSVMASSAPKVMLPLLKALDEAPLDTRSDAMLSVNNKVADLCPTGEELMGREGYAICGLIVCLIGFASVSSHIVNMAGPS